MLTALTAPGPPSLSSLPLSRVERCSSLPFIQLKVVSGTRRRAEDTRREYSGGQGCLKGDSGSEAPFSTAPEMNTCLAAVEALLPLQSLLLCLRSRP